MALADLVDHVIGVDPDRDRITAAVVCAKTQGELGSRVFPATARGYGQAVRWADTYTSPGRRAWSIESTGSYGAGLATALAGKGEFVIEFDHPSARPSKDGAKSDSLDAVRAAREILGRTTWATPRSRGVREGLRTLITARDSAKLARVAAINVLKALVVTAPVDLREELRGRPLMDLVRRCQRLRPDTATDPEYAATKLSLRSTANRVRQLTDECRELQLAMIPLVRSMAPALLDEPGIGVLVAARSWCRGPTPAAVATRPPSRAWVASRRWRRRRDRPRHGTGFPAAATGSSIACCTPSSWPARSTTSPPRTTSLDGSPRARPSERPCGA